MAGREGDQEAWSGEPSAGALRKARPEGPEAGLSQARPVVGVLHERGRPFALPGLQHSPDFRFSMVLATSERELITKR